MTPFHFVEGHCPGHLTQDASTLAVILGSLVSSFAHSCLMLKSNPRECMQSPAEARYVSASGTGPNTLSLDAFNSPDQKPAANYFKSTGFETRLSKPLPTGQVVSVSVVGSAWPS